MAKSHTAEYTREYDPPMPVVQVSLRIGDRWSQPVNAIIDSGADKSCVPFRLAQQVMRQTTTTCFNVTHGHTQAHAVTAVLLDFHIEGVGYGSKAYFRGWDDDALIGQDILAQLTVILDGKARSIPKLTLHST